MRGKGTLPGGWGGGCGRQNEGIDFSQVLLMSCLSYSERGPHL